MMTGKTWECYAWMPDDRFDDGRHRMSPCVTVRTGHVFPNTRAGARRSFLEQLPGHAGRNISVRRVGTWTC